LCGLAHCQDSLTDGFIADQALPFLGVSNARKLAAKLVDARLWHITDGGWLIHDYLKHNNSAATIRKIQEDRRQAGRRGGRPTHKQTEKQFAKSFAWQDENRLVMTHVNPSEAVQATVAVRERTAAIPQRVPDTDPDPNDHCAVITAVVTKDILPLRLDDHRLVAATIARCQQLGIAVNDDVARKAVDSALFRYYRQMRLTHALPADPRGIYHDHEHPKARMLRRGLTSKRKRRAEAIS